MALGGGAIVFLEKCALKRFSCLVFLYVLDFNEYLTSWLCDFGSYGRELELMLLD